MSKSPEKHFQNKKQTSKHLELEGRHAYFEKKSAGDKDFPHYSELIVLSTVNKNVYSGPGWCSSVDWAQACSIPSQGTRLGCGPGPQQQACEKQPHIDVSLPLFLLPFLSLLFILKNK